MSKPIAVVKPTAATVKVTNPVPAMAPALEAPNPVATSTPTSALPSPAAPNTADTATLAPSPVATAKPTVKHEPEDARGAGNKVGRQWLYCAGRSGERKHCGAYIHDPWMDGMVDPWMDGMVTDHKEPCPYNILVSTW
jgi:hypothetical protein